MTLKVICESGYSCCDYPKRIEWDGESHEIREVVSEWREPGAKHYFNRTTSGIKINLVFCETSGEWKALEVLNSMEIRSNGHG